MSSTDHAETAWAMARRDETRWDREVRVADFLVFAVLPWTQLNVNRVPINEIAVIALLALAALRMPRAEWRAPSLFWVLLPVPLLMMTLSAQLNGDPDWRRLLHMVGWTALVWMLVSGRVSGRSAGLGLATGLVAAEVASIAMIGSSSYPGRLTGFLGDPNGASLVIVCYGCVAMASVSSAPLRRGIFALLVVSALLAFSRTGLFAVFVVSWWVLIGRRLGRLGLVVQVAVGVLLLRWIPDDIVLFGPFESRVGSDRLRTSISAAEHDLIDIAPWYGNGPGTSRVTVNDLQFFFHNSYLAARNEGGFVLVGGVCALLLIGFALLLKRARTDRSAAWLQGALIATATMAATLGEVLLELSTAVAIGFAVREAAIRISGASAGLTDTVPEGPALDPTPPTSVRPDRR